ncbi:hypothetical protein D3C81_1719370 [compost metagenome]
MLIKSVRNAGYQGQTQQTGVLREVATVPVIVVVDRQAEVAVLAEADAPVVVEFMADKKTATGNRVESVTAAGSCDIATGVAIEAQVAIQHLQASGNLCA